MSQEIGKRFADRFEVTHRWERIRNQSDYEPRETVSGPLRERSDDDQTFATIVENGLWLQRAVAARWDKADKLAERLSQRAELNHSFYDSSRERIAAAYMLWPYHSARYYGYLPTETEERLKSRNALNQIQGILYNNIRSVMDVLRLWFQSSSDAATRAYIKKPWQRGNGEEKKLGCYAGDYEDPLGQVTTILVQNETLMLKLPGRAEPDPLTASSDTEFFDEHRETQVMFVKDDAGLITEVIVRINARESRARRIRSKRPLWRAEELTANVPDLCAIDQLVEHLMELIAARPKIRRAIETIQKLSLKDIDPQEVSNVVLGAFEAVHIAQMTVFYHPNPADVKDKDEIPLYELVHETGDMDPIPAKLIPFEDDQRRARNFRKLASTIYSVQNKKLFPNFSEHRDRTINRLNDATDFISDGQITDYFLSTRPPVRVANQSEQNGNSATTQSLWPLWYKQALSDFDFDKGLPDWSDHFWWRRIEPHELRRKLFQEQGESVHQNDHMSAYWDQMASKPEPTFVDQIEIPDEHPTGEPTFGYLMELLLRREQQTRTSFFFALAQTYEKQGRLCQFVGGTFLGLEFPGVPFSRERFEAIASRVRGLVMAVAHYTTTHAYKTLRWQAAQERSDFGRRVSLILRLLKGDPKDRDFARDHYLLFASPAGNVDDEQTDHDYKPADGIGWKPSRYQIKSVFTSANDLHVLPRSSPPPPNECSGTWKALFYLGGTANVHNRLSSFRKHWSAYRGDRHSGLSDRAITCKDCFHAALEFLLSEEMYAGLRDKITISDQSFKLPSRPGIRFLIALSRFIVDVQSQARSPENTQIVSIDFSLGRVAIEFDKPKLLEVVWEKKKTGTPNPVHTTGIFMMLEDCQVTSPRKDPWIQFLNSPEFATPLTIEAENEWRRMEIKWKP